MLKVVFENSAGALDEREVPDAERGKVQAAILEMIGGLDTFYHGDKIVIVDPAEVVR